MLSCHIGCIRVKMGSRVFLDVRVHLGKMWVKDVHLSLYVRGHCKPDLCEQKVLGFNWCACIAQGNIGPPGPEGMRGPRGELVRISLMNQLNCKTKQQQCDYSVGSLCFVFLGSTWRTRTSRQARISGKSCKFHITLSIWLAMLFYELRYLEQLLNLKNSLLLVCLLKG